MSTSYDYMIVGQGLAGTLLAHFLQKAGKKVVIFDNGHLGAASKVAAGIINPITGRRYVKSWRVDDLIPFAEKTYRSLEQKLNIDFYHPNSVIRSLFNRREENDWLLRQGEPGYGQYIKEQPEIGNYKDHTVPVFNYGEVQKGAQVDIGKLVSVYGKFWQDQGCLRGEEFDFKQLEVTPKVIKYKSIQARAIVFSEGYRAAFNPYFNFLPFGGAKGEVLIISIPGVTFQKMFKHRIFIVPLEGEKYWVGATYEWQYEDDTPTQEGRQFLEERLREVLKIPFTIEKHIAAIRPTVKDRRPFLGQHPDFSNLFIFNGLGTKGASLGPYWAKHMVDYLVLNKELDPAVNIDRFM